MRQSRRWRVRYDDWLKGVHFPTESQFKITCLEYLELENCLVDPSFLKKFLMAPKALSAFAFDELLTPTTWVPSEGRSNEYLDALLPHKEGLRSIHLHLWKVPRGERGCEGFRLDAFKSLKYLSIDIDTIFGNSERDPQLWPGLQIYLPLSLEILTLRVLVDVSGDFLDKNTFAVSYLPIIARDTPTALPCLRKFRVEVPPMVPARPEPDLSEISTTLESFGIQFERRVFEYDSL